MSTFVCLSCVCFTFFNKNYLHVLGLMENNYFRSNGVFWQNILDNFGRSQNPPFDPIRPEHALQRQIRALTGTPVKTLSDCLRKENLKIPNEMRALYKPLFRR